jgi:hypothetical protein
MANIKMHEFKHPKYYKELRKRNKSDQAISDEASTEATACALVRATSNKPQATSNKQLRLKPQATKTQATSNKPQAPGRKAQASSHKRQAP